MKIEKFYWLSIRKFHLNFLSPFGHYEDTMNWLGIMGYLFQWIQLYNSPWDLGATDGSKTTLYLEKGSCSGAEERTNWGWGRALKEKAIRGLPRRLNFRGFDMSYICLIDPAFSHWSSEDVLCLSWWGLSGGDEQVRGTGRARLSTALCGIGVISSLYRRRD
jgi:hypothetical protein